MSIQATSIFAASIAIGRLSAGAVLTRIGWYPLVNICIVSMALLVLLSLPLTRGRSEEHTSELQSLMRISYAVFCLKKKKQQQKQPQTHQSDTKRHHLQTRRNSQR